MALPSETGESTVKYSTPKPVAEESAKDQGIRSDPVKVICDSLFTPFAVRVDSEPQGAGQRIINVTAMVFVPKSGESYDLGQLDGTSEALELLREAIDAARKEKP